MPEILTLLSCLSFDLNSTSLKHLGCIIQALLAMSGRVTMLGISRWAGKGGSYRTKRTIFLQPSGLADPLMGVLSNPLFLSTRELRARRG